MLSSKFWTLYGYDMEGDARDGLLEPGVHPDSFWVWSTHDMVCIFVHLEAEASDSDVIARFGERFEVDMVEANEAASVAARVRQHGEWVAGGGQGEEQLAEGIEGDMEDELTLEVLAEAVLESMAEARVLQVLEVRPHAVVVGGEDEAMSEVSAVVPLYGMEMAISMQRWGGR
uniref:Uncharacterized protein n=1 Tax=Hemiselmis andersenii TaxID=464988 RepID=A0A6U2FWV7_HEMAN|mmetsp:Transcript_34091/g.79869  ORF Transcript_34091/g.79869 Transcript_34091/m.79869 type:complete len:173 (+) Transcript_34091:64-582(+)